MMDEAFLAKIHGVIPPLVTPLIAENELDVNGLRKLLEHVINGGVNAVFILGTTGEGPRLSRELKQEMIFQTCKIVKKRIPVLVAISDTSKEESIKLANYAHQQNADALVLAPLYYYSVSQTELLSYFKQVVSAVKLPLFIYNIPSKTHVKIEIETVVKAAQISGIVGLKDSSGDMIYFHQLKSELGKYPDFKLFIGPEELTAEAVLFGASGGVNGGANVFPQLYVKLYNAAINRDFQKLLELQRIISTISSTIYKVGVQGPNLIKTFKYLLAEKGLCKELCAEAYIPFTDEEKKEINSYLQKIQFPV